MRSLAWAGQWEQFRAELAANLTKPALVVPVFAKVVGAPHTVSVAMCGNVPLLASTLFLDHFNFNFLKLSSSAPRHSRHGSALLSTHACLGPVMLAI